MQNNISIQARLASLLIGLALAWLFIPYAARAGQPVIAVFYPDIREPYRRVFLDIIKGIEETVENQVKLYVLGNEDNPKTMEDWLEKQHVQGVITLGRNGLIAAKQLAKQFPVITGAVLIAPNSDMHGLKGITLTPDPEILFERLKELAPSVKRVAVVYSREHSEWLMARAHEAASRWQLELNAYLAEDLREAAVLYRDILEDGARTIDALWLLQDAATIDDGPILSLILKEAWDKNLIVFSSNPAHVRRGALFSLYPDNTGMGRSLARLMLETISGNDASPGIKTLQDLLIAVNLRTAEHLSLKFTGKERSRFDLVFPSD